MVHRSLGLLGLMLMVALVSGCGLFAAGPGRTVEKFLYALEAGKIEEAKSYCSSELLDDYGRKLTQQFATVPANIQARGGIKATEVVEEQIVGDLAQVVVRVRFGDGGEEVLAQSMIKENGAWKLAAGK
ncbi:DUF4878 domain-containing protein [Candidatus Chloroploca sp. M-50]|uniref:DUF4878 domain-containing protein n=1 Tax=Candidatus Chloroploca mongolica TaxID=2528176 RepID=A0ABS4D4V3_9CHLR|nr:DUF4878 domain-containing protein [Candidatus Chloroploca mongolica]MBP1464470.1 DUF4878 domain-containing protein [Candidatus Chloroploca mongolica]